MAKAGKLKKVAGRDSQEVEFFTAVLSNGKQFHFFKSSRFSAGVYDGMSDLCVYAIGNDDLLDEGEGVVLHKDLITYDGVIEFVQPSGKSSILVNPGHIVYIDGTFVSRVAVDSLS